ncbi:MAG: tetratricopeptide repeat protein [Roseivirga sp.]|nr:tetratricopeptide repeat protein [Roseivirga sp.]
MIKKSNSIKRIGLLIYPFFVLITTSLNGQSPLPQAYQRILNLDFNTSAEIGNIDSDIPNFDLYLENLRDVTSLIFSEDEEQFDILRKNEKARLRELKELDSPSPYNDFFRAEIKIQWAFIKLKFGEQWNGVWALRSAYKIINDNIENYPDFDLNYKALGLLHVIFGAVPDRYQWVLGIFGLEGDTKAGLAELYELMNHPSVFRKEIMVISALIESYLMENHEGAVKLIKAENKDITHLERYALALVLMKSHQSANAATLLQNSLHSLKSPEATPLFTYLLAETQFQEGNYTEAIKNYDFFLRNFRGINQLKDASFKAGLCALFMGDQRQSGIYFAEARQRSETDAEVDKNAQKLLDTKPFPDPVLLQIRFSIDGGFYQLADSLLSSVSVNSFEPYQQFELIYRKARLNHLQGNYEQAIDYYRQVISKEEKVPENYFVPNSFLQLGYLQQDLGNTDMALMYFEKVLTFRKHPYKNSLDSKAKIALKGLRKSGD